MNGHQANLSTRLTLSRELAAVHAQIQDLGQNCAQLLSLTISAFSISDAFIQKRAQTLSKEIREQANELEDHCLSVLALQHPLLQDLRFVVAAVRMATHFRGILASVLQLIEAADALAEQKELPPEIRQLAENYHAMLKDILLALAERSADVMDKLQSKNQENSLLHDSAFQRIIRQIDTQDRQAIALDVQLLAATGLLQRTGATIVVVAEEIAFIHDARKNT